MVPWVALLAGIARGAAAATAPVVTTVAANEASAASAASAAADLHDAIAAGGIVGSNHAPALRSYDRLRHGTAAGGHPRLGRHGTCGPDPQKERRSDLECHERSTSRGTQFAAHAPSPVQTGHAGTFGRPAPAPRPCERATDTWTTGQATSPRRYTPSQALLHDRRCLPHFQGLSANRLWLDQPLSSLSLLSSSTVLPVGSTGADFRIASNLPRRSGQQEEVLQPGKPADSSKVSEFRTELVD
jgi:hypothetical protein